MAGGRVGIYDTDVSWNDSILSHDDARAMTWLLFMPQLPAKPNYLRVKLARRLRGLGAVPLKAGVHVLPHRDECLEDFVWLREELRSDAGDAVIAATDLIAGATDAAVVARFNADRAKRYGALAEQARALGDDAGAAGTRKLRKRLSALVAIDFFGAPGRKQAEAAIQQLNARTREEQDVGKVAGAAELARGSVWVTRAGVKVDRIASAWLIRRFIDEHAVFRFVDPANYVHTLGEVRFDMFEGEYTHRGERCTFETLIAAFGLGDPALAVLAEIVHDIDVKDAKYGRAETAGVAALIEGIVASTASDEERVEKGIGLFDVLRGGLSR